MKVQELQQFLRSLAQPLEAAGGKRIGDDLVKAAEGLEPFKEKTISDFCNFLSRVGEHFVQHGELPRAGRKRSEKAGDEQKIREATQRVMALYDRAQDTGLSGDAVRQEMEQLNGLTLPELKQVAQELNITKSFRTKQDALDEIEGKIRGGRQPAHAGAHAPAEATHAGSPAQS
jgi:hypothetical protein